MSPWRRSIAGFTLIELLVVVVIIGILASVAVARFSKVRQRSHVAAVQSDLRNLAVAQEQYHMVAQAYSGALGSLVFQSSPGVTVSINEAANTGWAATASHAADAAIECGVYVGTATPANGAPATTPEVVACTF